MVDYLIGLVLLGLGISNNPYTDLPAVKGEETEATEEAEIEDENEDEDDARPRFNFRLDERKFRLETTGTSSAVRKSRLNTRQFANELHEVRQNFKEQIEARREAAKEELENRREAFKQELRLIRDTRKQVIVDKLNTRCQQVNEKRVERMTEMLGKLSAILTNVSNRSASASASGKDTTSVDTAITSAQLALADAQSAVASQAGEVCTITITSETNLKTDVGKVISGLQMELKGIYAKVIAARKAVHDAIKSLAQVTGEAL